MYEKSANPDERYHFEIWGGPSESMKDRRPSISYCENHNADIDFGEAALNFEMAANELIKAQRLQPTFCNWTAPVLHLIRQTLELRLKELIQCINWRPDTDNVPLRFDHDLQRLWSRGRAWLVDHDYSIEKDARLGITDGLIENIHSIDPSGDLFRFGTSRKTAFGRQKSSDRIGYDQKVLFHEFKVSCACIEHWATVITREVIMEEMSWRKDPYFDRDDFPKVDDDDHETS